MRKTGMSVMHNINNVDHTKKVRFRDGDADDDTIAGNNNMTFEFTGPTHPTRSEKFSLLKKIQNGVAAFFQSTTIHGVVYLARHGLHIIERYIVFSILLFFERCSFSVFIQIQTFFLTISNCLLFKQKNYTCTTQNNLRFT